MPYVPHTYNLPRSPIDQPVGVESLPVQVMYRLGDASLSLVLFDEAYGDGKPPEDLDAFGHWFRAQRLHALGFVDALTGARRCLIAWAQLTGKPAAVNAAAKFDELIPWLVPLRHSIEHEDERARRLVKGKALAVDHIMVREEPAGIDHRIDLFTRAGVIGRRIAATIDTGGVAGIEVNRWTLLHAREVCQNTFDAAELPQEEVTW